MSSSAMNTATLALKAQSTSLSMISTNLANVETHGYKTTEASFQSLVVDPYSHNKNSSGGVMVSGRQNIGTQGLIEATASPTDVAIDGDGFFVVGGSPQPSEYTYTRRGDFSANKDGYLVNSAGNYLMGWPTDATGGLTAGNVGSVASLEPINLASVSGSAKATGNIALDANLPAEAAVGDQFTVSPEVFDSLGVSHTIDFTFVKTGSNQWQLDFQDPVLSTDATTTTGGVAGGPIDITFNTDGSLASLNPPTPNISVTGWSTGAADSTITLDIGSIGTTDGLGQFASQGDQPEISVRPTTQDGLRFGEFKSAHFTESGELMAVFDNGESRAIAQIPLATFPNPDGLRPHSGNVYARTAESGSYQLNMPGRGGSGIFYGSSLEASTVDSSTELTRMIRAQQAYSSASRIISSSEDMFDDLMSAVR